MELKLRPHHLLCTQVYEGKGYDDNFTIHMNEVVRRLRTEEHTPVTLVFSTDDLCSCCPNMQGTDLCATNEKVKTLDARTAECFHLEAKTYIYQDLIKEIQKNVTPEIINYICRGCSWFALCACNFSKSELYSL